MEGFSDPRSLSPCAISIPLLPESDLGPSSAEPPSTPSSAAPLLGDASPCRSSTSHTTHLFPEQSKYSGALIEKNKHMVVVLSKKCSASKKNDAIIEQKDSGIIALRSCLSKFKEAVLGQVLTSPKFRDPASQTAQTPKRNPSGEEDKVAVVPSLSTRAEDELR
ncbi:hypothetical protein K491DRAFT_723005 [Lophiostoma macrostomum CBS 122681]|uniref:Uncharacterized protein n=1 Tax=Lophiostoma macrostomum CBS 122681 TaxID=1314788 RepID=A0A6A6SLT9_9PLEO|nr:hypothetical protein K491DRAFT_723005 [Lophiostoma macrostomum CBS 122681]